MATPRRLQLHAAAGTDPAAEAAAGLLQPQAAVSPKVFCDALGSRLLDAITERAAYDPTRTEAGIVAAHGPAVAQAANVAGVSARLAARATARASGAPRRASGAGRARLAPCIGNPWSS